MSSLSSPGRFPRPFGPFVLVSLLGEGGMAQVFRAVREGHMGFRKELAIKRIRTDITRNDETLVRSLVNEARLGGQLRHPNVVDTYEFGEVDGQTYIAMEFVNGLTLRSLLRGAGQRGVRLPRRAGLELVAQICEGLTYAHELASAEGEPLRLVHRDLKPENIILSSAGLAKIMDFGIARTANALYRTTVVDAPKGTLGYMSPEQLEDPGNIDHRSDLFAVGAILFEVLTGESLIDVPSIQGAMWAIVSGDYRARLDLLEGDLGDAREVVSRCLARERGDRYPDAEELGDDVRTLLRAEGDGPGSRALMQLLRSHGQGGEEQVTGTQWRMRTTGPQGGRDGGWDAFVAALEEQPPRGQDPLQEGLQPALATLSLETFDEPQHTGRVVTQAASVAWRAEDAYSRGAPTHAGPSRRRGWLVPAVASVAVVLALVGGVFLGPVLLRGEGEPEAEPEAVTVSEADGRPAASRPDPDRVPEEYGAGTPTQPETTTISEASSTSTPGPTEAPAPAEPPDEADVQDVVPEVYVVVNAIPWASWTLSGDASGAGEHTPYTAHLPPGTYRFMLTEDKTRVTHTVEVTVTGDEKEIYRCWNFDAGGPC